MGRGAVGADGGRLSPRQRNRPGHRRGARGRVRRRYLWTLRRPKAVDVCDKIHACACCASDLAPPQEASALPDGSDNPEWFRAPAGAYFSPDRRLRAKASRKAPRAVGTLARCRPRSRTAVGAGVLPVRERSMPAVRGGLARPPHPGCGCRARAPTTRCRRASSSRMRATTPPRCRPPRAKWLPRKPPRPRRPPRRWCARRGAAGRAAAAAGGAVAEPGQPVPREAPQDARRGAGGRHRRSFLGE